MIKILLRLLVTSNFIATAHAAVLGLPDTGTILQQVQPVESPAFSVGGPRLMIEKSDGKTGRLLSSETFPLEKIKISSNSIFETKTLLALVEDAQGHNTSLSELTKLAMRITDFYRGHGYPLARTIIPAQTIENGVVELQVIEPRYGKISLDNKSRVRDSLLQATISKVKPGQFVEEFTLDNALLLLSDVAGITVIPALKSGSENGTSDLLISTTSGPLIIGNFGLDNHGNKYTGSMNAGGAMTINNPFHNGDTLDFNALTSGVGMNYQSLAYETLINGRGAHLGGSFSSLDYVFKVSSQADQFLDVTGSAKLTSLWVKQALWRSREKNVYCQITYEQVALKDHLDGGASHDYKDRHLGMVSAIFSGDFGDPIFVAGNTSWNLRSTFGNLNFDPKPAQALDPAATNTSGSFFKLMSSLTHVGSLGASRELLVNLRGQWANRNLDSSQKMGAGGPYSVRAYASGVVSGDQGAFLSVELRQQVGSAWGGQWTATAFFDSAAIKVNKNTWDAGENSASLTGVGIGMLWSVPGKFSGSAYIAAPIGSPPALVISPPSVQFSLAFKKQF
jgi:hemolysin activation/secretion protein